MPIPSPRKKEANSKFMTRCINSLEEKNEFKDAKQRIAICYSQLTKKSKKSKS